MNEEIERAFYYGIQAHKKQYRKISNEFFVIHPIRVWQTVRDNNGTIAMQVAALLHDVLEDTDEPIDSFSSSAQTLVRLLTKENNQSKVDAVNKIISHPYKQEQKEAMIIKMADRYDNIITGDEDLIKRFIPSTNLLLQYALKNELDNLPIYIKLLSFIEGYNYE